MSIKETAAQLDLRAATVKTWLHRARKLLRQHLDQKLASVLNDTFPFADARCTHIGNAVTAQLGVWPKSVRSG